MIWLHEHHSTSKKLFFITYLLEDELELSLGMLICLQRIYNFLLFHAVILSILDVNHFIVISYHFLVLTYWHSAKCQLLCSACFLHCRKPISNGAQAQRNFTGIFLDQKEHNGPWLRLGGAPRRAQLTRARQEAQVRPGRLCPPRGTPRRSQGPLCSFWSKKNSMEFRCVWTPSGIDFLRCKKHVENNNWHLALCQ